MTVAQSGETADIGDGSDSETELSRDMSLFDSTFIGATREGLFQQSLFGAIPEEVGQRAQSTVIMTERNLGITSWMRWWFKRRNG